MATIPIAAIQKDGVGRRLSALEEEIRRSTSEQEFFAGMGEDPHLTLVLSYVHGNQFRRSDKNPSRLEAEHVRQLGRSVSSVYMRDREQFHNLARMIWILDSSSRGPKDSFGYSLYKASGIDPSSGIFNMASIRGFEFTTLQCPGIAETVAGLGDGYGAIMALATGNHLTLRLYGENGIRRNRHLSEIPADQRAHVYGARKRLAEALNIPVIDIDIPEEILGIPDNLAIARGMAKVGYRQNRNLDEGFIEYLLREKMSKPEALPARLSQVIESYTSYAALRKSRRDYQTIVSELREYLAKLGRSALHEGGVHSLADAILYSLRIRNCSEAYAAKLKAIGEEMGKLKPEERQEGGRYSELQSEKSSVEKRQKELEREVLVWRKIFPSTLDAEIARYLTAINRYAVYSRNLGDVPLKDRDKLEYVESARENVEYYIGEVRGFVQALLNHQGRALVVVGNPAEQNWHELVFQGLKSPTIAEDLLWMFGGTFGKHGKYLQLQQETAKELLGMSGDILDDGRYTAEMLTDGNPGIFSITYSHYRLAPVPAAAEATAKSGQMEGAPSLRRPITISYGPSTSQLGEVPLLCDSEEELYLKLDEMSRYDPDMVAVLAVNAVYSMLNPGDRSEQAGKKFERNRGALSDASSELPEAYRASISVFDPEQIPAVIDHKIRREYDASSQKKRLAAIIEGNERFRAFASSHYDNFNRTAQATKEEIHSVIRKGLIALGGGDLERAIDTAVDVLSLNHEQIYHKSERKLGHVKQSERRVVLEHNIEVLANLYKEFYHDPQRGTNKDTAGMSGLLDRFLGSKYNMEFTNTLENLVLNVNEMTQKAGEFGQSLSAMINPGTPNAQDSGLAGPSLEQYIGEACETILFIRSRKEAIEEARQYLDTRFRAQNPRFEIPREFSTGIGRIISEAENYIAGIAGLLLGECGRAELAQQLDSRFRNIYRAINERMQIVLGLYRPEEVDGIIDRFLAQYLKSHAGLLRPEKPERYKGSGIQGLVLLLADVSRKREREQRVLLDELQHNPFMAMNGLLDSLSQPINIGDEAYLLGIINQSLAASEQRYMEFTEKFRYAAQMMLPHELQQAAMFRNRIATWREYYQQAGAYLNGQSSQTPFNPEMVTRQADSLFSISAEQAARFIYRIAGHLRGELGADYFAAQERAKAAFSQVA